MKRCNTCNATLEDNFQFCPVDGKPLSQIVTELFGDTRSGSREPDDERLRLLASDGGREFSLTMVDSAGLPGRLATEVLYVFRQLRQAWPDVRRDPLGAGQHALTACALGLKRFALAPHVPAAGLTAISLVLTFVLTLMLIGRAPGEFRPAGDDAEELGHLVMIDFPMAPTTPHGSGVGAESTGRVGFNNGKGEGSESEPQPARGGGGSGGHNPLPPQQGKVPQPSEIPAPINLPLPHPALPVAGVDLDPALWRSVPIATYGDPRSKSTAESKGPGDGDGIGTGDGLGLGEGRGNGVGPGEDGNIGGDRKKRGGGGTGGSDGNDPGDRDRIFTVQEVTQRARVISKPEALYTDEARRNQIMGTAVLRVVFSATGEVTNIRALHPLPMGLTEKAIAAARQIRFLPATRNGQPVSVYVQLEYNFNIY